LGVGPRFAHQDRCAAAERLDIDPVPGEMPDDPRRELPLTAVVAHRRAADGYVVSYFVHRLNSAPPKTAVPHLLSPGSARVVPLRSRRDRLRRTTVPPVPRLPLLHGGIERRKAAD